MKSIVNCDYHTAVDQEGGVWLEGLLVHVCITLFLCMKKWFCLSMPHGETVFHENKKKSFKLFHFPWRKQKEHIYINIALFFTTSRNLWGTFGSRRNPLKGNPLFAFGQQRNPDFSLHTKRLKNPPETHFLPSKDSLVLEEELEPIFSSTGENLNFHRYQVDCGGILYFFLTQGFTLFYLLRWVTCLFVKFFH